VILFSAPWCDRPLETFAQQASEWGYAGLELCSWGQHFAVQRALAEPDYCQSTLDVLTRLKMEAPVLSSHGVGQALGDLIDERHQSIVPDHVWSGGAAAEISERAGGEMIATIRAAQRIGCTVVSGFSGSTMWSAMTGYPSGNSDMLRRGFAEFARRWRPVLDACRQCDVRFALEVHPGQVAYDLPSAEMTLEAVGGRKELGFLFDPSHLHWQGINPVEFIRAFADRIYHVHVKDIVLNLNGRNGLLSCFLPPGDPRRGWDFRSPGRGGIDWEALIRALNDIGYDGALSVDWNDAGMDRDYGAVEACRFVKRLLFPPAQVRPLERHRGRKAAPL
jgi:sugar phosphate isomerase/epimerase